LSSLGILLGGQETNTGVETLLNKAKEAYAKNQRAEAIQFATQAIESESTNARCYFFRARLYEEQDQPAKAAADYDSVIKLDPSLAEAWQHRGIEHFKLGKIGESIADFDRYLELRPNQAPFHWQRGIACYYGGKFDEGRKQFESHQTVNPNDVENAVWHFLCVAKIGGIEKARGSLIPIKGDARVPMMQVHALFAGKGGVEDVLKAAGAEDSSRSPQMFYANLYLGLYYEAMGDAGKSVEYIRKAAEQSGSDNYMGQVARVHLQLKKQEK
jgi:lipoprotein NlpI